MALRVEALELALIVNNYNIMDLSWALTFKCAAPAAPNHRLLIVLVTRAGREFIICRINIE